MTQILHKVNLTFLSVPLFLIFLTQFISPFVLQAQKTVEFRINGIASNIGDMDGFGSGDSDPQWNYEVVDNTFGISGNDNIELSGTNCPGIRSHVNTFFAQQYDCELPTSFNFIFRGFEDDGLGSDANSGDRTFTFNTSTLITTGSTTWRNVHGGSGWVEVRASGTTCSVGLNTAASTQGSGSVRYQIRLQYRVLGTSLCHDECNDPYVIPTAAEFDCGPTQISTPLNINISALEPADASQFSHTMAGISCTYDGSSAEDIWLRTTIPDSTGGVIIQFENNGGCNATFCQTNITYAWYTSSNGTCSGLEYRGCDAVSCFIGCSDGQIRVDGRAGEDVWVRIWEEDDQGFNITINQITPTAPADRCYTAMPVSNIGCNYQATSPTTGPYAEPDLTTWTDLAHPDLNPNTCSSCICQDGDNDPSTNTVWSSNENLVWYTFTQDQSGPFDITVLNMTCVGGANTAQLGVFTNSGTPQSPTCDLSTETGMGCSVGVGTVTLNLPNLPAGDYILVVDGNAGAECEWTFLSNTILELRMLSFNAYYSHAESAILLDWEVHQDDENEYFFIERSTDGYTFEEIASLFSEEDKSVYTFTDEDYPNTDYIYYRIKAIDHHDVIDHSEVRVVRNINKDLETSGIHDIYPNPTSSDLHIPMTVGAPQTSVGISIIGIDGRLIKSSPSKWFDEGYHILTMDVSDLDQGLYYARIEFGGDIIMRKVQVL